MAHEMTMTNAMQKFTNWYNENVTTFHLKTFMTCLELDGCAHHYTDDGKLFKVLLLNDGTIQILIMKNKLSLYRKEYRERLQEIVSSMINGINHNSNPKMTPIRIGEFASWCANDDIAIDECGINYSDWAHYIVYEDELYESIDEITFTNDVDDVDSYSVNDSVIKKLWVELYDIKGKVDNIVNILGNVGVSK